MDRRSFMLGLAASTAAVPIAGLPVVADLAPCDLHPGALNFVYGHSPALDVLEVVREATRELYGVTGFSPEWRR